MYNYCELCELRRSGILMKNKGFEFSFAWLFAVFVGATILFLAIYAATRLIDTGNLQTNTEIAAQLDAVLSPLETNLEASKSYTINLPQETKIFNTCMEQGNFGQQEISTSTNSLGAQTPGLSVSFLNKYIFSSNVLQGKQMFVFVKPYYMPYKVADLMIMYDDRYCFVDAPSEVQEDIEWARLPKVNFTADIISCARNSTIVCFTSGNECDVNVDIRSESVNKGGKTLLYYGPLLYGAIFSDPTIYSCQVERIKKRTAELAQLYAAKASLIGSDNCAAGLAIDLQGYAEQIRLSEGGSLRQITFISKDIGDKNEKLGCPLF